VPFCCPAVLLLLLLLLLSCPARIGRCQAVFARPEGTSTAVRVRFATRAATAGRLAERTPTPPPYRRFAATKPFPAPSSTEQYRVESNTFAREACSSHDHFPHRELGTLLSALPTSVALDSCSAAVGGRFECRANASRRMTKALQPVLTHRPESAIPVLAGCINTSECVTLIYPCVLALLEPPRAFRCHRFS
jgi:hypothetical protein